MTASLAFSTSIVAFSIVWAFICNYVYRHVSKGVDILLVCLGVVAVCLAFSNSRNSLHERIDIPRTRSILMR